MTGRAGTLTIIGLASLLGGCGPANIYELSPEQVYAKLIVLEHGTPAVIEVDGVRESIHGTPSQSVTWVTDYAHSYYECTATLTPEGSSRTSVNVGCSDEMAPVKLAVANAIGRAAAAEGMPVANNLKRVRNRYIELVDSTLDGRPFDDSRARSQAMGWPDPPS